MTAERYAQVRRLFLAACELAESERGAFLDHACTGDAKLREELESLLKQPRATTIIGTQAKTPPAARSFLPSPVFLGNLFPRNLFVGNVSRRYPRRGVAHRGSVAFFAG